MRWIRRARHQLQVETTCRLCRQRGLIVEARVADHIQAHRGDRTKFLTGELQSLCFHCHSSRKQSIERLGYDIQIGEDGWPVDAKSSELQALKPRQFLPPFCPALNPAENHGTKASGP